MTDSETDLAAVLAEFVAAPTWTASQGILDRNPVLLSDAADVMLGALAAGLRAGNPGMAANLAEHRRLLARCRAVGVDAAFAEKLAGTAPGGGEDGGDDVFDQAAGGAGTGDPAHDVVDDVPLGSTATDALRLAGMERRGGASLDTAAVLAVLAALCRVDMVGEWDRLRLHTRAPDGLGRLGLRDPDAEVGGSWGGVPLTRTLVRAVRLAGHLADAYDLSPVPAGVLALALVADPRSAAARGLLDGSDLDHPGLVRILQEVLDTHVPLPPPGAGSRPATGTGIRDPQPEGGAGMFGRQRPARLIGASREDLIGRLERRIGTALATRNSAAVLAEEAVEEAAALVGLVASPAGDIPVARVLGWWHWVRYLGLPEGEDQRDLAAALTILRPVYLADPDEVPEQVRQYFDSHGEGRPGGSVGPAGGQPEARPPAAQAGGPTGRVAPYKALADRALELVDRGDTAGVDEGIDLLRRAAEMVRPGGRDHAGILSNLGRALGIKFRISGDAADATAAVDAHRQAVAVATASGHPQRAGMLSNLGVALHFRYERTGDLADLDASIDACRQAVEATPVGDPDRVGDLSNLGACLHSRYERTGEPADLDAAIEASRQAVDATHADSPDRAGYLDNLGDALRSRFMRTGDMADLDAAVTHHRAAVDSALAGHRARPMFLSGLSVDLYTRYIRTNVPADLDQAIDLMRRAVDATRDGRPGRLSNLGSFLRARFERTRDRADLDTAIDVQQRALDATSADDPAYPARLCNLATALATRSMYLGTTDDLDPAVDMLRRAAATMPADHPDRVVILVNLAGVLQARYGRFGASADLDEAIALAREAAGSTRAVRANPAEFSTILAEVLLKRHLRTGGVTDVDEAVEASRRAVDAVPSGHVLRPRYLSKLGDALLRRHKRTGALGDLDEAVRACRLAVDACPFGDRSHAQYIAILADTLHTRFGVTGSTADLDEAVTLGMQAVGTFPADDPGRPACLSNVASILLARHRRVGAASDLESAIDLCRQAVDTLPADHPDRADVLANLGSALQSRFERGKVGADLDDAIDAHRRAADAVPADHANRPGILANLATALRARHERGGEVADLEDAVEVTRRALAAIADGHPDRVTLLTNLGSLLRTRHRQSGVTGDLAESREVLRAGAQAPTAPPSNRAQAAREWARVAMDAEDWADAADAYAEAISLRALTAPRGLGRADQEHELTRQRGLGPEAAACCLKAGEAERAVSLSEQGRGVLLGQAMDSRANLAGLPEDLATRFTELRAALDTAATANARTLATAAMTPYAVAALAIGDGIITREEIAPGYAAHDAAAVGRRAVDDRRVLAEEFDDVLRRIRATPGFENFLLPPPVGELLTAAADGPVVLVNVAHLRSDALVLRPSGVDVVPLPNVDPHLVADQAAKFFTALDVREFAEHGVRGAEREWSERRMEEVLGWLWDAVAGPVLEHLGITGSPPPGQPWPRLWWCPSGMLSFLPLHAAGHHGRTDGGQSPARTVLDRVVSSYTPTVRALARSRRRPTRTAATAEPADGGASGGLLVVAMPTTPGAGDLPGAELEAELLGERFPGRVTVLTGDEATFESVSEALPRHPWAHFACHGASDLAEPSAGRILLSDHQTRPLTMLDVTRLPLAGAELAFLSACSTSQAGIALPDEAIHLASAFQLAGYRHVVATLWQIFDPVAVQATIGIYHGMAGANGPDSSRAALAVHGAVRRLRATYPDRPLVWAAHIHVGG